MLEAIQRPLAVYFNEILGTSRYFFPLYFCCLVVQFCGCSPAKYDSNVCILSVGELGIELPNSVFLVLITQRSYELISKDS